VDHFIDPAKAEISPEKIVLGEFVDLEKPSYEKLLHEKMSQIDRETEGQVN